MDYKRKTIILFFSLIVMVFVFFVVKNYVKEEEKMSEIWNEYALIAEAYSRKQDEYRATGELPDATYNELYFAPQGTAMDNDTVQTFLVYDVNGDGVPELFISRYFPDQKQNVIYDAFTWKEGKVYQFMGDKELGYRNGSCDIRDGGYILSFYSGTGWDYGFEVLKISDNGTDVELVEKVYAKKPEESGVYYSDFYKTGNDISDPIKITETEYIQIRDSYKMSELNFFDNNKENIELLRNGKIKY